MMGMVDDILRENGRRRAEMERGYDPVAGDGADGERILLPVEGLECRIPVEMAGEQLVRDLVNFGSVEKYLAGMKGCVSAELTEALLREWTRLRCRYDFPFWAASFAYIKRKGGGDDMLFRLNRPQRKLVEALETMRRAGSPIRLILLKARQWGGSTCVQLYMAWLQLVHKKGLNSLIIAHQSVATDEIKDMFDRMLRQYPEEMIHDPEEDFKPGSKLMECVGGSRASFRVIPRNCKVKLGTAETPDSCRGGDYNLVHCSEVGLWKSTRFKTPEQIVRAATSGVLLRPMTMILYESTANGTGNFFHKEYEAAKRGESQFKPLFVAWYEIEQYSAPFSSSDEMIAFAGRLYEERESEQSSSDRRQPGAYLWWLWTRGATLEAINWYVAERAKYSSHGLMAAEYPSDDVEAFVHSGANVFDRYKVEELRGGCCQPVMRGEIDGDRPSDEDSLRNVRFNPSGSGALMIWKDREILREERVSDRYLVVVDIGGRSLLSDWSVIVVIDRVGMCSGGKPEVVAQWRGHLDFDLLAWKAARIAAYYDNALLVIESNTLETHDALRSVESDQSSFILNRLRNVYPNLYARRQSEVDIREGVPVKYGFHTNVSTKPMIISSLVQIIREGMYVERDEMCLSEYLVYERSRSGAYAALPGHHDDILMTRAIGLHICFYEMPHPRRLLRGGGYRHDRPSSAAVF